MTPNWDFTGWNVFAFITGITTSFTIGLYLQVRKDRKQQNRSNDN